MKKIVSLILAVLFAQFLAFGQNTVSGTVFDQNGEPLPGVAVQIKNTSNGALTDAQGNYSVSAAKGETLVFSC